jgi:hypothetical protein
VPTTILKHWKEGREFIVRQHRQFPLAEAIGIPEAFRDGKVNYDLLRGHYGPEGVYINYGKAGLEWKEETLLLQKRELERALLIGEYLTGYLGDPFTVQAIRRGVLSGTPFDEYPETGIYCFTETPDRKYVVVGIRGKGEGDTWGQIIAAPVGSTAFNQDVSNPIKESVYVEGNEEIGIARSELRGLTCIGVYRQEPGSGADSHIFMYRAKLTVSGEEIIERHADAMRMYEWLLNKSKGDNSAKTAYARAKMELVAKRDRQFPRDPWENAGGLQLLRVDDPELLLSGLEAAISTGGLKHGMVGAAGLYILDRFGDREYGSFMDSIRKATPPEGKQDYFDVTEKFL